MSEPERSYAFDPAKAASNVRKHGVTFDDGFQVLMQDENLLWQFLDQTHDDGGDRWIVVGPYPGVPGMMLHITWTDRDDDIRIISVRRATPAERRDYENRYRRTR